MELNASVGQRDNGKYLFFFISYYKLYKIFKYNHEFVSMINYYYLVLTKFNLPALVY